MLARQLKALLQRGSQKAIAERMRLGLTLAELGLPDGEVGVRERLRRRLRRSLELEEIHMEMSCDKGYSGHSRRKAEYYNVMHGSEDDARFGMQVVHIGEPTANVYKSTRTEDNINGMEDNIGDKVNAAMLPDKGSAERVDRRDVMNMSLEEISQHPLVMKMLERLEALEVKQKSVVVPSDGAASEEVNSKDAHDKGEGLQQERNPKELEVRHEVF